MADNAAQRIKTEVAERRRRASGKVAGIMRNGRSGESGRRRAAEKSKRQGGRQNAQRQERRNGRRRAAVKSKRQGGRYNAQRQERRKRTEKGG